MVVAIAALCWFELRSNARDTTTNSEMERLRKLAGWPITSRQNLAARLGLARDVLHVWWRVGLVPLL